MVVKNCNKSPIDTHKDVLEKVAQGYNISADFDYFNTKLASRILCPVCAGRDVLEVGCASGEMTEDLIAVAKSVTVVEPASHYAEIVKRKFGTAVTVYNSFVHETQSDKKYDVIVLASVLHHLQEPKDLLNSTKKFMVNDAVVVATVPNSLSLHRQIGVAAGLLDSVYANTARNVSLQQFQKFEKTTFETLFTSNGFDIIESYGYMLKPFSNEQMMQLHLEWNTINALFEIGKQYQHIASQLYIKAQLA